MNTIFREHSLPLGPCPGKAVKRVRGLGGEMGKEKAESVTLFSVSPRCRWFGSGEKRHLLSLFMSLRKPPFPASTEVTWTCSEFRGAESHCLAHACESTDCHSIEGCQGWWGLVRGKGALGRTAGLTPGPLVPMQSHRCTWPASLSPGHYRPGSFLGASWPACFFDFP